MKYLSIKNRIWKYLLSGFICVSLTVIAVFQVNAYYMNASTKKMTCEKQTVLPTSNCLTEGSQSVLLGSWDLCDTNKTEMLADIIINGGTSVKEGYLSLNTASSYIKAEILNSDLSALNLKDKLTINANENRSFKLRITINNQSIAESSDELISVAWTDATDSSKVLKADFIVPLMFSENTIEEVVAETEESGTEETTTETETDTVVDIVTVSSNVLKTNPLLLSVTFPEGTQQIEIGTNIKNEEAFFPAYTRYTTDGGESYTVLYEGGKIVLDSSEHAGTTLVQVDFSACNIEWKDAVYNVYARSCTDGIWSDIQTDDMSTGSSTAESFLVTINSYPAIVSKSENLVWNISCSTSKVEYSVEILTKDGYKEVTEEGLSITSSLSNGQGSITISSSDGKATAGTYRMTLTQIHDGVKTGSKIVNFFVNYR